MDTNDTERECNEPQYTLRRQIERYSRQIIHAIINCNLRLRNMTFPEWIQSHYHDIYHLCYNTIRCNHCALQYILPEHRQLHPRHLHSLFEKDFSNPRHNSSRAKDIGINDIDIVLAGCLVDHFCDSVYWVLSLNLLGRTLDEFLNENKSEIYDLVDTSHVKSRGNRGITADDISQVKSRSNRGITTDDTRLVKSRGNRCITTKEWESLFGSDTNVFHGKDRINHVSAKWNITLQHLYEANTLLPRILLNHLCPFKKKVDSILCLAKMAFIKKCDWINKAFNDEFKRTSDEILSWLQCCDIMIEQGVHLNGPEMFTVNTDLNHDVQCCDIMIEQGVHSNGPEMFTENTDLNHDGKLFLEQSMFGHAADDDTKLCMDKPIDEHQQLDTEHYQYNKYIENLIFVQRSFSKKEEADAIAKLQFNQSRLNRVLIPQLFEPISKYRGINAIPSDTFFKTPQQRLASFIHWPLSTRYWPGQLAEAGFVYTGREWVVRCFMCNQTSFVNTWIPPEKPEEAHARLNPTCNYVVDMNYKTCQTSKTVKDNISTKQLPDANITSPNSLDMHQNKDAVDNKHNQPNGYTSNLIVSNDFDNVFSPDAAFHIQYDRHGRLHDNQRVKISVDDALNVCSDGMNDMVGNQSTAIEVDHSDSTNEVVHPHEATIEVDSYVPVSDNTPGMVSTTEHNLIVSNDNGTACNGIASESKNTNHWLQNGDISIKHETINQINYQENFVKFKYPAFQSFVLRMKSFNDWPYTVKQRPDVLANAGYFYTGDADIVRCFCCDLGVAEWAHTDDAWVEHARHSSTCWFLKTQKGEKFIKDVQVRWKKIYNPKHAVFEDRDSRFTTYEGVWRPDIEQTPDILANAGFFYTGIDDVVRCHYCDGGLRNWESGDDPWEEHARWFPFCKYIIKMKGKEYIDSIRRKYEVIERNEELVIESEEIFTNHPFVQQLADLSFQTEDIKTAMRHFTQNEGHSNFTLEDLIETIIEKNGQLQGAFSASNMQAITEPEERNPQNLREINKQLKESILCVRCKTNEISMLFPNCGHRVTCETCAYQLKVCPHCKKKIKKRMKTFLS